MDAKEDARLWSVALRAGTKAAEAEGKRREIEGAFRAASTSAVQALRQLDALFSDVAEHKHELVKVLQAVRKRACQPVTDAASVCHLLRRAVHHPEGVGAVGEEHALFALRAGGGGGGGGGEPVALEFVVTGGGTACRALQEWKQACRVHIASDFEWEALPEVSPEPLPALNTARYWHAAVVTRSNGVFVVGGFGMDNDNLASMERLVEGKGVWEDTGLAIPTGREGCGACAVGNTVVVVGGNTDEQKPSDLVEAVDTSSGSRTTLPPLPRRVRGCGVVSTQGKVIVTGGHLRWGDRALPDGTVLPARASDAWELDVAKGHDLRQSPEWASLPAMCEGRSNHGTAVGAGCVFVCGGTDGPSCEMLQLGEDLGRWELLPPMPEALSNVGCCFGGGNVFVVGGDPNSFFPSKGHHGVFAFNLARRAWARVAELGAVRLGCAAVCVGRRVMVLGGSNRTFLASCEVLGF